MTITQQEAQWIQETVEKLKTKWKPVTERNVGKIPYSSKDGVFDDYSPKMQPCCFVAIQYLHSYVQKSIPDQLR